MSTVGHIAIGHVSPFIAFSVGVVVSIKMGLNGDLKASQVWWISVPVGFVTIGNMLLITMYEQPNVIEDVQGAGYDLGPSMVFGYMSSLPQYLTFCGTLMLYGTLVPNLFYHLRGRVMEEALRGIQKAPNGDENAQDQGESKKGPELNS